MECPNHELDYIQALPSKPHPIHLGGLLNEAAIQTGVKYDGTKPRIDLVDAEFLEGLGEVLGFGAQKYAAHNWRGGIHYSRLIAAAYRHLGAINKGEDLDPESGLPHTAHLGCCIQFLHWMMKHRTDMDDRFKYVYAK